MNGHLIGDTQTVYNGIDSEEICIALCLVNYNCYSLHHNADFDLCTLSTHVIGDKDVSFVRDTSSKFFTKIYSMPFHDTLCNVRFENWIGDGSCDTSGGYNTADCHYDGGDCCEETCESNYFFECYTDFDCKDPAIMNTTTTLTSVTSTTVTDTTTTTVTDTTTTVTDTTTTDTDTTTTVTDTTTTVTDTTTTVTDTTTTSTTTNQTLNETNAVINKSSKKSHVTVTAFLSVIIALLFLIGGLGAVFYVTRKKDELNPRERVSYTNPMYGQVDSKA